MAERHFEAERSAWIKSRRWPDKQAAARRAELLSRRARQLDRAEAGLGASATSEGLTKGTFARWTSHEDSKTSALGFIAFGAVYLYVLPVFFGIAWIVSWLSHRACEAFAASVRPRVWPYLVAAVGVAAFFFIGRPLGWDLLAIVFLARVLEDVTGGLLEPAALSRWWAAGWVSWLEAQVVLGLMLGGWRTYAWGWSAPAVRRDARGRGRAPTRDKQVRIISDASTPADEPETPAAAPAAEEHDPIKLISGGTS